jgi:hypothetical protein
MPSPLRLIVSATLVAGALLSIPAAASAGDRGVADPLALTVVRGSCVGQGHMVVTVHRHGDGSFALNVVASGLVDGSHWDGGTLVVGGGGGSFTGMVADGGVITDGLSGSSTPSPMIVDAHIWSTDTDGECRIKVQPATQSAMTLCHMGGRKLTMSAVESGDSLDVQSRLRSVPAKSAWTISAHVVSPHSSQGAAAAAHASDAGVVRFENAFDFVVYRTVEIAYANPDGKGCAITVATRRDV